MLSFARIKREATLIRKIFKGEPEAYGLLIAEYQPAAYAVALATTGNPYLADKAVAAAFIEGYNRLVSLTDAKRLGALICTLAQHEAERLAKRRVPDWNRARKRDTESLPVDLKLVQSELMDPLNEEISAFTLQERKGLLLYAFGGYAPRRIAETLKIERKEAEEDLARTRENVEKALLKEVVTALDAEVNNKERMLFIMKQVAGDQAARKAAYATRLGKPKRKLLPIAAGVAGALVFVIAGYFGVSAYRVFSAGNSTELDSNATAETESVDVQPEVARVIPSNYAVSGRIVDSRFPEDGVAGVTVSAAGQEVVTDFYGAFEIRGVPRGQHEGVVSADGVELDTGGLPRLAIGPHIKHVSADGVEVKTGVPLHTEERNPPIEIDVDHNVSTRFHFRGRVLDRNTGQPITRFEVATCKEFTEMLQPYLLRMGFREQHHPEGLLRDRFVTLGEYTMYVRANGYAPLPHQFAIDEHWDNQELVEFRLYPATKLRGTVYSARELSIARAMVIPRQGTAYGIGTGYVDYARTDTMGNFQLDTLPVGVQSFIISHPQHGTARAIVELEPGQTTSVRVQVPRPGALTGDITLNGRPTRFSEFRRRLTGSSIDLSKSLAYNSPGQYEITLAPEPVTVWASVAPGDGDQWFERRLEYDTVIATNEPTWVDFNFDSGPGEIQCAVSLRGATARSVFVELAYHLERSTDRERIFYNFGTTTGFRIHNLPLGSGEMTVYAAPRPINTDDFASARLLMESRSTSFSLDNATRTQSFEFAL